MTNEIAEYRKRTGKRVWERMQQVATAANRIVVRTNHALKGDMMFVKDDFARLAALLETNSNSITMALGNSEYRAVEMSHDRQSLILKLRTGVNYSDVLEAIAGRYNFKRESGYCLKDCVPSEIVSQAREFTSRAFFNRPSRWSISGPQTSDTEMLEAKLIPVQAVHIARLLVATALIVQSQSDGTTNRLGREAMQKETMRQLYEYLSTGNIKRDVPKKINVQATKTHPKALLSVNDDGYELIWKHPRYCRICGDKLSGCFCTPITDEVSAVSTTACFDCEKKLTEDWLRGKYVTDKIPIMLLDDDGKIMEYLRMECGDIKPDKKKWTDRKLKQFWKAWGQVMSEFDEFDGPEDGCSCPGWGGEK